jgi:ArsR family transcriptional regulator, arsenate/arsenite/antimonite-responsive transcriptional repressor
MREAAARSLSVEPVTQFFRALGDETRVRIVALLAHGELCVCHVQEALGLAQPTASRQLAILKQAGIVQSKRMGTWTYHGLAPQADEQRRRQLRALVEAFSDKSVLRKDVERLVRARGPGACK